MKIITATEPYDRKDHDVFCFLAGGISNCLDWQKEVIKWLEDYSTKYDFYDNLDHLILFNPRSDNFQIHDPNASEKQIAWEFKYLEQADIFSMYFCSSDSVQPICMYELGRHLHRLSKLYPEDFKKHFAISIEDNYKRKNDVIIQCSLALGINKNYFYYNTTPKDHAYSIMDRYVRLIGLF